MVSGRSVLVILGAAGGGDRPPVVKLAVGLRDRGHRVTILCDSATEQMVASTGLRTVSYGPEQRGIVRRWMRQVAEGDDDTDAGPANPLVQRAELVLPFSRETASDLKPDLIVSSLFSMGLADTLATDLGIPWCFVNPSFYFGDHSSRQLEDEFYGPFIPRLVRDCFLPLISRADIVLHATDPIFDPPPSQLPPNHHYVGFLLWEPSMELPEFLQGPGDPWALVTASTTASEGELTTVRSALTALSGRPVRTLLTLPDPQARRQLGPIPDNATVAGFVPHTPVLQQCSITISQAGHGVVSKCLRSGVPMVLMPWNADQPGVAARAEALNVAAVVPRIDVSLETVEQAVARVLDQQVYQDRASSISVHLERTNAVDEACNLVESM